MESAADTFAVPRIRNGRHQCLLINTSAGYLLLRTRKRRFRIISLYFDRVIRRGRRSVTCAASALFYIIHMFVGLHVYAQISFGGRRVVAYIASIRLVPAFILLATAQTWMLRILRTIHALLRHRRIQIGRVLLFHVYVECFVVFVVPVAFRAFELLARVARMHRIGDCGTGRLIFGFERRRLDGFRRRFILGMIESRGVAKR